MAERANLTNPETGKIEGPSKALKADSISSVAGACVGCPPVNFQLCRKCSGRCSRCANWLISDCGWCVVLSGDSISTCRHDPRYATSGALIYVAFVMMSSMQHVDWKDFTNGALRSYYCVGDAFDILYREWCQDGVSLPTPCWNPVDSVKRRINFDVLLSRDFCREARVHRLITKRNYRLACSQAKQSIHMLPTTFLRKATSESAERRRIPLS